MRQINLLPEKVHRAEERRSIRKSLITAVSLTSLVVLSIHLLSAGRVERLEKIARQLTSIKVPPEISQLRGKIARLKVERQTFIDRNRVLLDILSKDLPYPYILKTIGNVTSDMVWLTGFSIDSRKGTCQIDGQSFNTSLVSEFMLELKKLPYFESVDLTSMERRTELQEKGVDFKITCKFK
ncbi:MAG: PilN domain-containing protein [Candidatus Omnitrophica bacterium]|nr:PilN domain-containing protein [Candidatus Omnitrophota bacterium]